MIKIRHDDREICVEFTDHGVHHFMCVSRDDRSDVENVVFGLIRELESIQKVLDETLTISIEQSDEIQRLQRLLWGA